MEMFEDDLIPRPVPRPCQLKENLAKPEVPEVSLVFDTVKSSSACTDLMKRFRDNETVLTNTAIGTPHGATDSNRISMDKCIHKKYPQLSENVISANHVNMAVNNLVHVEDTEPKLQDKKRVSFSLVKDQSYDVNNLELKLRNHLNGNHVESEHKCGLDTLFTQPSLNDASLNIKQNLRGTCHLNSFTRSYNECRDNCNFSYNQRTCGNNVNLNSPILFHKSCECNIHSGEYCSPPEPSVKTVIGDNEIYTACKSCNCNHDNASRENNNENSYNFFNPTNAVNEKYVSYDSLKIIFQKIEQLERRLQEINHQVTDSVSNRMLLLSCQQFDQQLKVHQSCCVDKYDQLKSEIMPLFKLCNKIEQLENKVHSIMLSSRSVSDKCEHDTTFDNADNRNSRPVRRTLVNNSNICNDINSPVRHFESKQNDEILCSDTNKSHVCLTQKPYKHHNMFHNVRQEVFSPIKCCNSNSKLGTVQKDIHSPISYVTDDIVQSRVYNECAENVKLKKCCQNTGCQLNQPIIESLSTLPFSENSTKSGTNDGKLEKAPEYPPMELSLCNKIAENVRNIIKIQDNVPAAVDTTQLIKNITYEYLQKLNLRTVIKDNIVDGEKANKTVDVEPKILEENNKGKMPSSEIDTSLRMNSLAMKYFSNELSNNTDLQNNYISNSIQVSSATNVSDVVNNVSYATLHYLQRYQLLPSDEPITNKLTEMQYATTDKIPDHHHRNNRNSSNILDATAIRQQPKFL